MTSTLGEAMGGYFKCKGSKGGCMMLVLSNGLQCRLGEGVKIRKMQTSFKCGPKAQLAWHYWQKKFSLSYYASL